MALRNLLLFLGGSVMLAITSPRLMGYIVVLVPLVIFPLIFIGRRLRKQGCRFATHKGGSGHVIVRRGDRTSQLPMHGSRKELGAGLVGKNKRELGLE